MNRSCRLCWWTEITISQGRDLDHQQRNFHGHCNRRLIRHRHRFSVVWKSNLLRSTASVHLISIIANFMQMQLRRPATNGVNLNSETTNNLSVKGSIQCSGLNSSASSPRPTSCDPMRKPRDQHCCLSAVAYHHRAPQRLSQLEEREAPQGSTGDSHESPLRGRLTGVGRPSKALGARHLKIVIVWLVVPLRSWRAPLDICSS